MKTDVNSNVDLLEKLSVRGQCFDGAHRSLDPSCPPRNVAEMQSDWACRAWYVSPTCLMRFFFAKKTTGDTRHRLFDSCSLATCCQTIGFWGTVPIKRKTPAVSHAGPGVLVGPGGSWSPSPVDSSESGGPVVPSSYRN